MQKPLPSRFSDLLRQAKALNQAGQPHNALQVLAQTLESGDRFDPAHAVYLQTLLGLGLRREALKVLEMTLQLRRDTADACDALAYLSRQLDRHEQAYALYRTATEWVPDDPRHWYNLATSARNLGRLDEATTACQRALAMDPGLLSAVLLRSEIHAATPDANHVEELIARLGTDRTERAQMFIAYALGKELHELGRYEKAFEAFALGAAVRRRNLRYDVAVDERKMARIREAFNDAGSPAWSAAPYDRHLFIVGLPRSGTTLTERILSSARGVRSNGETNNFSSALLNCVPSPSNDLIQASATADPEAIAREYDQMAAYDAYEGIIIEKLPLNFLYIGVIARALPASPIVWVRRNPLDSCFAMFRTLFGAAYPFSYDFEELARYHSAYERLMQHWQSLWPERLIEVDYDELVTHPREVARKLAERCRLPWTEDLVEITRNPTASLTASASQIRQPIHSRSSGIWRSYQEWLRPLEAQLKRYREQG